MNFEGWKPKYIDEAMRNLSLWQIKDALTTGGYLYDGTGIASAVFVSTYHSNIHNTTVYSYATIFWDDNEGQWDKGMVHVWRNQKGPGLKADF